MAENCSYSFQDSMDKLWFHQNILFWEPSGISFQSLVRSIRATTSPTLLLSNKSSSTIENGRSTSVNKKREIVHKEKMPMKLNIAVDQPLFQLQLPRIRSIIIEPRPSPPPCFDAGSPSKPRPICPKKEAESFKRFPELESNEIKGFVDLGFVFHKERLSPKLISILPGLQRLQEKCGDSEKLREVDDEHAKRPHLSEALSIRGADSPPLDPQLLFKSQPEELQNHLRFWARDVASMIRHDLDVI